MGNEAKLSSEQINSVLDDVKNGNTSTQELMKKHLNEQQQKTFSELMSNPDKLRQLMQSPVAQKIIEALKKEKDKS